MITIGDLPELLGFVETAQLKERRQNYIKIVLDRSSKNLPDRLMQAYMYLAEQLIESGALSGENSDLGLIVRQALIYSDAGLLDECLEALYDARDSIQNRELPMYEAVIDAAIHDIRDT